MDSQKNQIADSLKKANNVLVTVSTNPTVDQLAGAIGLTLLLNKLGKHATAVFSGQTPSTLEFLQPEKTLEKDTNSLRDFIIALDKSKADKLRYKVEDQMVKIFITPYRTSISDQDLEFSQGDFNVEVVMALGVNEQPDLDQAITGHGRILHDATVVSVNTAGGASLGSINWVDPNSSSLCEMLVDLGLDLQADVLDAQMATAFLTGIVAETNRFSNEKTSSETMQMSAKLMAAGANQQLIASQLQAPASPDTSSVEGGGNVSDGELPEIGQSDQPAGQASADGSLQIDHVASEVPEETVPPEPEEPEEKPVEQIRIDENGQFQPPADTGQIPPPSVDQGTSRIILDPPSLGGRLTANSEPEALDPSLDPLAGSALPDVPLLSHNPMDAPMPVQPPVSDPVQPPVPDSTQPATTPTAQDILGAESTPPPLPDPTDTLSELERSVDSPHLEEQPDSASAPEPDVDVNSARDAVMDAVNSTTPQVLEPVQALNAQPMDLNLGDMPAVATSQESAFSDPGLMQPMNSEVASDPGIPPGVVPPASSVPDVDSEAQVFNPTAPPPVPPPMLPPEDNSPPGLTAL